MNPNINKNQALFGAVAATNDLSVISFLLENGAEIDARDEVCSGTIKASSVLHSLFVQDGCSVLDVSAKLGNDQVIPFLLEKGAQINATDQVSLLLVTSYHSYVCSGRTLHYTMLSRIVTHLLLPY